VSNDVAVLNFVGDVALFNRFEIECYDPLANLNLPSSDFNVANFEFPLQENRKAKFFDVLSEYNVSVEYAKSLKIDRFDLYGLANNHISDYGEDGINDTVKILNSFGSATFGVSSNESYDVYRKNIEGIDFSFIAAVKSGRWESAGLGPNIIDKNKLQLLVAEEKRTVDHVILFFHWGTELVDAPDPSDVTVAHDLIDAGASCVIGHHPHVSQGVEEYSGGVIAYSLGSNIYLSECEKGNVDSNPIRDTSICLNICFSKEKVVLSTAYKYKRKACISELVPTNMGEFSEDVYFSKLNNVIGDKRYYSSMIRKVLVRREAAYFFDRFKKAPLATITHSPVI